MKFGIRSLLLVTVAIAAVFSWMQLQTDRSKRIQIACDKLRVASDNQFDPVAISNAFRYLKSIGVHETVLALNQLEAQSETSIQKHFICSRLPLLFEPAPGLPKKGAGLAYSGGLIFGGFPGGPCSLEDLKSDGLVFSELSFIPDDNLSNSIDKAMLQLVQQSDSNDHQNDMSERYVKLQASVILGLEDHSTFFRHNSVRWNKKSEQFEHIESQKDANYVGNDKGSQ